MTVLATFALAATAGGAGAMELSIDEVVARALADNPEIQAARAEIEAATGRLHQAGLRPNPMLDLGGEKALGPDNNVMVGVSVPLDLNGRREGRVGVARRELELKRAQVDDRERRLRAEVRTKAGEVLAARRNLAVTEELLGANREGLRLVAERVREGRVPPLEESLMQVEVSRLEASRQMLESRVEVATVQLKALAGLGPDAPLRLRGDLGARGPVPVRGEALRRALEGRPDMHVARADVALGTARIRREQAEGRWDASVNMGYQRQDFSFGLRGITETGATRPIRDVFHFFGAGVTIMLPLRNRNEGNVTAARAEARAAERRLEGVELAVHQEVDAAFTQYEAARRALDVYERGVRDVSRRNLDVIRQSYDLGRGTLLDVVAEQRRLIEVENGYTEALRQVYDATVEIERAVGSALQ